MFYDNMDTETSHLPTSSRPPPAGQDSVDFNEGDVEENGCSVSKDITSSSSKVFGTPRRSSHQNPAEIVKKLQPSMLVENDSVYKEQPTQISLQSADTECTNFYENWRNSFESLMSDSEGRSVFYKYLVKDKHNILLDCLEACEIFRALPPKCDLYVSARDFYKRFIQFRDPKLKIREQTRSRVNHCMRTNSLHTSLFTEVEQDVYDELRSSWYDRFLDSDYFLNYCLSANQNLGHEMNERRSKEALHYMPTLHEEGMADSRLHAERHGQYGAHGKEITGKSMKLSDGLRRPVQDPNHFVNESPRNLSVPENISLQESMMSSDANIKQQRHKTRDHQDYLPKLPHFKPRTERINREAMKPMKPEDFAKILCEKLEKVIQQRALAERSSRERAEQNLNKELSRPAGELLAGNGHNVVWSKAAQGDDGMTVKGSCVSQGSYPQSDRYSAVGMSSVSSSEIKAESQLKYKHGAKELASAVHHALRTELKECQCQQCLEKHNISERTDHQVYDMQKIEAPKLQSRHCPCCLQNQQQDHPLHQRSRTVPNGKLTSSNLENLEPSQNVVDHNRIYMWMEQSEKYRSEMGPANFVDSSRPSPAIRTRHRDPVVYDTTRPGDNMSGYSEQPPYRDPERPLQQPDTGVVLEETKRRLEDNARGVSRSSRRNGSRSSRPHHSHHGYMQSVYAETALSTTSGNWTLSDSASSASRQQVPSVVSSSIPSSASHALNQSMSDIQTESMKSQGSGSSRGNRKDKTIVTYFLELEPIPYRTSLPGKNITLAQFKPLITKKGNFRYFFKTKTKDDGPVYQQVEDDSEYLPKFENKIVVKVEKVE